MLGNALVRLQRVGWVVFALSCVASTVACGGDDAAPRGDRLAGQSCVDSLECESGFCLAVSATRNICTLACTEAGAECPDSPSWSCMQPSEIATAVCVCQANAATEICGDGLDNDCDGNSDDCQVCNGRVVPFDDRVNCGACGNVCPIGNACVDGECECPGSECVDAGSGGPECLEDGDCNDEVECTQDSCVAQRCIRRVVPARCPSGEVCDLRMGGCIASRPCADNSDCEDDDPCTTNEICDPSTKVCLWVPLDGDHDNDPPRVCGGSDCDDDDPTTLLGASEICDGADNDCDGNIDDPLPETACSTDRACVQGGCQCTAGTECGLPSCIDTESDVQHCGTCFNDCPATASCEAGTCTCPDNGIICLGGCVDPMTDRDNCGGCFTSCFTSQSCVSGACVDTDECASGLDNCDANATCTNTTGSFTCACNAGFGGSGVICAPDECLANTDSCDVNATCTDTLSGFLCNCNQGYSGDGNSCSDVNECTANSDNCDNSPDACVNTVGSFMCVCPSGYTGSGVTTSGCTDINECTELTDNCDVNALCTNSTGGFSCTCNAGYTGNGVTCAPNAALTDLTSSYGALTPAFTPSTRNYTITVPLGVESLTLTPTADVGIEIRINTEIVLSGNPSSAIALLPGANAINIAVSGDGYADSGYVLSVNRGMATYVKASNTGASDNFGYAVAVDGNTVVIGAPLEDGNYTNTGAAYVFTQTNGVWSQQAVLRSATQTSGSIEFGAAVAISGDTIVVGSRYDDVSFTNSGAAHVFVRSGSTWSEQAKLKASNVGPSDYFGISVAISGESIVVGASAEDSATAGINGDGSMDALADAGAAYVFTRSGTTWAQQAFMKPSNPGQADYFGIGVAISGNTVAVGAYQEDSGTTTINGVQANEDVASNGAVYVFTRSGTAWSQQAYVKPSTAQVGATFGESVSISDNSMVVGASRGTTMGIVDSGLAYVFVRSGTVWTQQAVLSAGNAGPDFFGDFVSIGGDVIVVGAMYEDSSATGLNGTSNELAADAGAAYLFRRTGSTWAQTGFIKATNTGVSDYFGVAATDGISVVVGAIGEDSSATGVNGSQTSNATSASGAVYIY